MRVGLKLLFAMLAFLGAVTSASAQDKGTAVTSSAAVGLNDKSGNQAEVMIIETAEKDLPSASNVTEVSTRSVVRKEIVRTPEMLERKKQEPKLNEPQ